MEFIDEADIPLLNAPFNWTKVQRQARQRVAVRLNREFSRTRFSQSFHASWHDKVLCDVRVAGYSVMFLSDASFMVTPNTYTPSPGRALTMDEVRWVLSSENQWIDFKMVRKRLKRRAAARAVFAHSHSPTSHS